METSDGRFSETEDCKGKLILAASSDDSSMMNGTKLGSAHRKPSKQNSNVSVDSVEQVVDFSADIQVLTHHLLASEVFQIAGR